MSEPERVFHRCPCCGAHALDSAPDGREACPLCRWRAGETDKEYSLDEARANVRAYSIAYRPSDERFAGLRHPILGPAGETAIDRVALRQRAFAEFANFAQGREDAVELPERLRSLRAILGYADRLYRPRS